MDILIPMNRKVCKKCGEEKELDEFVMNKECRNGRAGTCKRCNYQYAIQWQQNNGKLRLSGIYEIPASKVCARCGEEKNIGEFGREKGNRDGCDGICKQCNQVSRKAYHSMNKELHQAGDIEIPTTHICSYCHTEKTIGEFYKDTTTKRGYDSRCKKCTLIITRDRGNSVVVKGKIGRAS